MRVRLDLQAPRWGRPEWSGGAWRHSVAATRRGIRDARDGTRGASYTVPLEVRNASLRPVAYVQRTAWIRPSYDVACNQRRRRRSVAASHLGAYIAPPPPPPPPPRATPPHGARGPSPQPAVHADALTTGADVGRGMSPCHSRGVRCDSMMIKRRCHVSSARQAMRSRPLRWASAERTFSARKCSSIRTFLSRSCERARSCPRRGCAVRRRDVPRHARRFSMPTEAIPT